MTGRSRFASAIPVEGLEELLEHGRPKVYWEKAPPEVIQALIIWICEEPGTSPVDTVIEALATTTSYEPTIEHVLNQLVELDTDRVDLSVIEGLMSVLLRRGWGVEHRFQMQDLMVTFELFRFLYKGSRLDDLMEEVWERYYFEKDQVSVA